MLTDEALCWAAGDKMDPLDSCMSFHKNEAFAGRGAGPEHAAGKPVGSPGSLLACVRPLYGTPPQAAMPRQALYTLRAAQINSGPPSSGVGFRV